MEMRFLDKNSILGPIISQNSVCYPTKDKKVIRKLDRIFIFEKIKRLSIADGQGLYQWGEKWACMYLNCIISYTFVAREKQGLTS